MFVFGKKSKKKLKNVDEVVKRVCKRALEISTVDFSVIDGFRTQEQQREMFDKGASELDGTMKISDHQTGMAVDVIPFLRGYDIWDTKDLTVRSAWLELYRAFMRAAMQEGVELEFGLGYNISGGRDWPHISFKG
jgi:peptidoglycan L-alanyl-D-glutamate endopeptidase CwlK